jgi:hypothetical protein
MLGDEERVCTQCGAVLNVWSITPRAPLILPGNPALSDDVTSNGTSAIRRVSVALAAVAVVGGITFAFTREPAARDTTVAVAAAPEAEAVDSASAMSSGVVASEEELSRARAARDSAAADSARAANRALASLPPIPSAMPATGPISVVPAPQAAVETPAPAIPTPVASAPVVESRVTPTERAPATVATKARPSATTAAAVAEVAKRAAPTTIAPSPELRMAPLVSSVLRSGENLRLRGSVQDRATGRELSTPIRFSSSDPRLARVDSRTGVVRGIRAGKVKITADAGNAGRLAVDLSVIPRGKPVVIAPQTPKVIVPPKRQVATAARPSAAIVVPERPAAVTPATTKPAISAPVTNVATAPAAVAPAPLRDVQRPDAGDVRAAADRFVADVRNGLRRTDELRQFFGDGAEHRASVLGAPSAITETATGVRATFDMRLSKFDAAGRPLTRVAPVTIEIVKREGALNTSAVAIGALHKP